MPKSEELREQITKILLYNYNNVYGREEILALLPKVVGEYEEIKKVIYKWEEQQRNKGCQGRDVFDLDTLSYSIAQLGIAKEGV